MFRVFSRFTHTRVRVRSSTSTYPIRRPCLHCVSSFVERWLFTVNRDTHHNPAVDNTVERRTVRVCFVDFSIALLLYSRRVRGCPSTLHRRCCQGTERHGPLDNAKRCVDQYTKPLLLLWWTCDPRGRGALLVLVFFVGCGCSPTRQHFTMGNGLAAAMGERPLKEVKLTVANQQALAGLGLGEKELKPLKK